MRQCGRQKLHQIAKESLLNYYEQGFFAQNPVPLSAKTAPPVITL
jgi:hypothetical protein